jgi:hypothetical protein
MNKRLLDKMPATPDLNQERFNQLKCMEGTFICLEQALDTKMKRDFRAELGERLVRF